MKQRCLNPNSKRYPRYGGRGITICTRWLDFANFLEDMGEVPEGKSIDRINNDGNYEPSNCRWATKYEQANNTSRNRTYSYLGKTLTIAQWAEALGLSYKTLISRLNTDHSNLEEVLSKEKRWSPHECKHRLGGKCPVKGCHRLLSIHRKCRRCGITFYKRACYYHLKFP